MKLNKLHFIAGTFAAALAVFAFSSNTTDAPTPTETRPSTVKPFALPDVLDIAGEALPLHRQDVREKLDREILVNTYWQSNNLLMLKRSSKFFPIIEPILAKNHIPDDFKYLVLIESGLQNVVSPAGAAGYWQIMKNTGTEYGLEINSQIDERYHIAKSTEAACKYLSEAHDALGSWTLAAAAYNMGRAGAARRMEQQQVNSYYDLYLNAETSRYVFRIAALKYIHTHLEEFGYVYGDAHGYTFPHLDTLTVNSSVDSWIDWALEHGTTYQSVRHYNPWIRDDHLNNTQNKEYQIWVPKE